MVAGNVRGAPPSEIGPTWVGCRAIFLRVNRDIRFAERLVEIEAVTSGFIALFSESTFAISKEIWPEIFFTS